MQLDFKFKNERGKKMKEMEKKITFYALSAFFCSSEIQMFIQ